jgi:asparagine N-glycosylation enzyme membrane subunit Stt3
MKRSDILFLTAAFLSFLFSIYLWFNEQRDEGIFVGIWVPSILSAATLLKQILNQQNPKS